MSHSVAIGAEWNQIFSRVNWCWAGQGAHRYQMMDFDITSG